MGRAPCCPTEGMAKGAWTALEDKLLTDCIAHHGVGRWSSIAKLAGLKRCAKSCRLRWLNYLRPGIKRGNIQPEEEDLIIRLHRLLGNRWSLIAGRLPGRTDNEIKNYWNTILSKKRAVLAATTNPTIFHERNQEPDDVNHTVPPTADKQTSMGVRCTQVIKPNHTAAAASTCSSTVVMGATSLLPLRHQPAIDGPRKLNLVNHNYSKVSPAVVPVSVGHDDDDDLYQSGGGEATKTTTKTTSEEEKEGNCESDCCWDDFPMDFHDVVVGSAAKQDDDLLLFGRSSSSSNSWNVAAGGSDELWSMLNDWFMDGQG